jgi:hypothetical protein
VTTILVFRLAAAVSVWRRLERIKTTFFILYLCFSSLYISPSAPAVTRLLAGHEGLKCRESYHSKPEVSPHLEPSVQSFQDMTCSVWSKDDQVVGKPEGGGRFTEHVISDKSYSCRRGLKRYQYVRTL